MDYDGVVGILHNSHGKATALDVNHPHAPLPLLFLVHEYMARGKYFYRPIPDLEVTEANGWQDWMVEMGVVNEKRDGTFTFKRDAPPNSQGAPVPPTKRSSALQASSAATAGPSSDTRNMIIPPTADLIEELMAYQHTMPSWRACQMETMGWEGTAEENTKKYVENIGVESAE